MLRGDDSDYCPASPNGRASSSGIRPSPRRFTCQPPTRPPPTDSRSSTDQQWEPDIEGTSGPFQKSLYQRCDRAGHTREAGDPSETGGSVFTFLRSPRSSNSSPKSKNAIRRSSSSVRSAVNSALSSFDATIASTPTFADNLAPRRQIAQSSDSGWPLLA